jgi:phospholipid/cholesterol/gamma-HCH transport system substrate-binding protein
MPFLDGQFSQRLSKLVKIQLAIFMVVAVVAAGIMIFGYIRVPALFGVGQYTVTVQLPRAGGLYATGNVTYRGTEVGRVTDVRLTDTGVDAVLSLRSDVQIPSDLDAQVHSVSGVGEQYVALLPRGGSGPALKNGDVIPLSRSSVPPDINTLLDAANRGLQAIPGDNLKTMVDESYTAFGGLGPEISRIVKGSTNLAIDARANLDPLVSLIDQSQPVLDSQADSSAHIHAWANHLANLTHQLKDNDSSLGGLIQNGGPAADEGRQLFDRLQPGLPTAVSNLVPLAKVGVGYAAGIEQLLVDVPQDIAASMATIVVDESTGHPGENLDFNLNLNLPPICATGYLPIQQQRVPAAFNGTPDEGIPDRPPGDIYCRIPQDSPMYVRGARNFPCQTRPGKRAPTAAMCESDENYVPLNDGLNWKGDPNATLSGQAIPQRPPGSPPAPAPAAPPPPPPIAAANYDPQTGNYVGSDGTVYDPKDLAKTKEGQTWQSMLTSPAGP